jgi:L-seryl-tRNA(Ser) seleniumtransferase
MGTLYERLGVRTYVNATGHETRSGGSLMPPEVLAAMHDAAQHHVWLPDLQAAAGHRVAEAVGAPAALVTSGAAGAILLAVAGCLTGIDREKALALPRTPPDRRNRVLVWRMARPNYLYPSAEAAGGVLVEVGQPDAPIAPEAFGEALAAEGHRAAAVLLMIHALDERRDLTGGWEPFVRGVCRYAGPAGVPVLVDAAAELPPRGLVRHLLDLDAAGVMLSGGKAIRGPQSTGILAGRPDLVAAAAANNAPEQRIGRPLKVGKEELCGLVAAVERFWALDEAAQLAEWRGWCREIAGAAAAWPAARGEVVEGVPGYGRPPLAAKALVHLPDEATAEAVAVRLRNGDPGVRCLRRGAALLFNPMALLPGDADVVAQRLREALRDVSGTR